MVVIEHVALETWGPPPPNLKGYQQCKKKNPRGNPVLVSMLIMMLFSQRQLNHSDMLFASVFVSEPASNQMLQCKIVFLQ